MSVEVKLEVPGGVLAALRTSPEAFTREFRLAAAVKWFELGALSQGRAAELAGLSRAAFLDALGRYGVSPFQISPEDLLAELDDG